MSKQVEHLQALVKEQRELIKKLLNENLRLNQMAQTMRDRIHGLEQQHLVINEEPDEIPIDLDLVPEQLLNKS